AIVLMLGFMMPAARAQGQPPAPRIVAFSVDVHAPVAHLMLSDVDGDGLGDLFFVTKTRPAWCLVARRTAAGRGFALPVGFQLPEACDGLVLQRVGAGAGVLVLAGRSRTQIAFSAFKAPFAEAPPPGPAPLFLGFAGDLDGDGVGDPMLPTAEGFEILLSK